MVLQLLLALLQFPARSMKNLGLLFEIDVRVLFGSPGSGRPKDAFLRLLQPLDGPSRIITECACVVGLSPFFYSMYEHMNGGVGMQHWPPFDRKSAE